MKYENNINELTHKFTMLENRKILFIFIKIKILESNQFNAKSYTSNNNDVENIPNISFINSNNNSKFQLNSKQKSINKNIKTSSTNISTNLKNNNILIIEAKAKKNPKMFLQIQIS